MNQSFSIPYGISARYGRVSCSANRKGAIEFLIDEVPMYERGGMVVRNIHTLLMRGVRMNKHRKPPHYRLD